MTEETPTIKTPLSEGALEDINYLASKYGIAAILQGLCRISEIQLERFGKDIASQPFEKRRQAKEWRSEISILNKALQATIEFGPGSGCR